MNQFDKAVTLHPYFKVRDENLQLFKRLAEDLIEITRGEMGCLYYGISFSKDEAHCREAYKNAETLLAHLDHVSDLLERIEKIAEISRVEIHGPASELAKVMEFEPMKRLNPKYFVLEGGFRN